MTKQQIAAEALDRVLSSTSTRNFPAIYGEFMARGIAESDILPRVNVFTYAAWQAKGRQVRKGEKGVRVVQGAVRTQIQTSPGVAIEMLTSGKDERGEIREQQT